VKPDLIAAGTALADQLIPGFPGDRDIAVLATQGMAASATRGFALASLEGPGRPTTKTMKEAR
jgi:hypothetical protein